MTAGHEEAAGADGVAPLHCRRRKRGLIARKMQHAVPTAGTRDHPVIGRNKFRSFTARWDEIHAIHETDREATVRTGNGRRRRLNLADLKNAPDVRQALTAVQMRLAAHQEERLAP